MPSIAGAGGGADGGVTVVAARGGGGALAATFARYRASARCADGRTQACARARECVRACVCAPVRAPPPGLMASAPRADDAGGLEDVAVYQDDNALYEYVCGHFARLRRRHALRPLFLTRNLHYAVRAPNRVVVAAGGGDGEDEGDTDHTGTVDTIVDSGDSGGRADLQALQRGARTGSNSQRTFSDDARVRCGAVRGWRQSAPRCVRGQCRRQRSVTAQRLPVTRPATRTPATTSTAMAPAAAPET